MSKRKELLKTSVCFMGFEQDYQPSPTPKLSLFSFPTKRRESPWKATPPIHTLASVPFQWEEAPGKPIPCATTTITAQSKPKIARCLELPPRLLHHEVKVSNVSSPTTVLDGPHVQSVSLSRSTSLGKGSSEKPGRKLHKDRTIFGSSRWGSFRRKNKEGEGYSSTFDLNPSVVVDGKDGAGDTRVKMTRVRRSSSFLSFSSQRSHLLMSMYESFKKAVPRRRRQE